MTTAYIPSLITDLFSLLFRMYYEHFVTYQSMFLSPCSLIQVWLHTFWHLLFSITFSSSFSLLFNNKSVAKYRSLFLPPNSLIQVVRLNTYRFLLFSIPFSSPYFSLLFLSAYCLLTVLLQHTTHFIFHHTA